MFARYAISSSLGFRTPYVESFSLLNDISPFTTVLDADCLILYLHFTDILFNIVIPSALRSFLYSCSYRFPFVYFLDHPII